MSTQDERLARHQRIRGKQVLLATAVYLTALIPLTYINSLGLIRLSFTSKVFAVALALAMNAVFYVLVRSNANLRFRDPSMTFVQVMFATMWSLFVAMIVAQPARPLAMVWYLLAFLFGFYTLKRWQFVVLSLFALVGYALVVLQEYMDGSMDTFRIELLHWLILATGLFWMSLVGSYVSMLRHRLAAQRRQLAEMAFVDPLTEVYNRRHISDVLERALARRRRERGEKLCVAMLDLDEFKAINDRHGHLVGDRLLHRVASLLRNAVRDVDAVGRYGGEEFIVVMPATDERGARISMERIRRRIGDDSAAFQPVTVSIGIAEARADDSMHSLIERADVALYAAKQAGRNTIISASTLSGNIITPTAARR